MTAMDALLAAREAWLRTDDQLSLEVDALTEREKTNGDNGRPLCLSPTGIGRSRSVNASQDPASEGELTATPTASQANPPVREAPRPEKLVGGTIGASPPSRRASPPSRMRPPTGTHPVNQTADGCSPSRASAAVGMEVTV